MTSNTAGFLYITAQMHKHSSPLVQLPVTIWEPAQCIAAYRVILVAKHNQLITVNMQNKTHGIWWKR